jgi:hypothetical protein
MKEREIGARLGKVIGRLVESVESKVLSEAVVACHSLPEGEGREACLSSLKETVGKELPKVPVVLPAEGAPEIKPLEFRPRPLPL